MLVPAATDLHVHFREPGLGERVESLADGTLQAALGGVALVGEMPNTEPPVDSVEHLRGKMALARGRLAVDLVMYALARPGGPIDELSEEAGAFKLYLSPTTGVAEAPNPDEVRATLEAVARTGLPLTVHAEDPRLFRESPPATTTEEWSSARPLEAERQAAELLLPAPPALRLHVAHVTDPAISEEVAAEGHSFEATPHHLLLSTASGAGPQWKVNPPLRSEAVRAVLWQAFSEGRVPIVASDHAPHSTSAKELPFARAPSGVPGVETMLPLLLEQARRGNVGLATLLAAACDRPARWFGAPIGRIAVGHRADLLVVDFRRRRTLRGHELHSGAEWTPFEGSPAVFPQHHLRAGVPIVEDGEFVGGRVGRVVRPEFAPGPRASPRRAMGPA
ncbi:MAG: amidohydrolase family protein [Thermoplasmata archaeon]|nr:amidohydrolase family protein [Thermoplasmata archaeon]